MLKNNYNFSEFGFSSKMIRDLVDENKNTSQFISSFFSIESIKKQLVKKKLSSDKRLILQKALNNQNSKLNIGELSQSNIDALVQENVFTITTGHQLNLLTGPLYSIYKIIQVINWSEKLNELFPGNKFVPTFWMATEDHDFEEINHIHLFNSKIEWNKSEQNNFVAGKIKTDGFRDFESQVLDKFSDEKVKTKVEKYLSHYKSTDLASATRSLINDLFGEYGLVIIDGDDILLKQEFQPIIERELNESVTFKKVTETNAKLNEAGYHNQVHLRECNLFYIENKTTRHRIVKVENGFEIDSKLYSKSNLLDLAKQFPERFSPNALIRPLYQEFILPNLVYFGGGGEIAYWLQLKDLFDELNLTFPLLRVRDSYVLLSEKQISQIDELNYSVIDLKQNLDDLIKVYTKENATSDISMSEEYEVFNELKSKLNLKVENKDLGIKRFIEGELVKIENQLEKIEKKLIQNEKKNLEQSIKQIQKLKDKIYPKNGFQERYENILQYISDDNFIQTIKKEAEQSLTVQPQIKVFKI